MSANDQQMAEYADKGKGKQAEQHTGDVMEEDDSESEESGAEQPEEVDDNLEEIDPSNITSSRTRGKQIDWAEAELKAKEAGDDMDDDDDDDDGDFEDPEEETVNTEDRMED